MLALVSLINPIRGFGEKKQPHSHACDGNTTDACAHTHFELVSSIFLWKCLTGTKNLFIGGLFFCVLVFNLVMNTGLNQPATRTGIKPSTGGLLSSK